MLDKVQLNQRMEAKTDKIKEEMGSQTYIQQKISIQDI